MQALGKGCDENNFLIIFYHAKILLLKVGFYKAVSEDWLVQF